MSIIEQKRLDVVIGRSKSEHLFTMKDGTPFDDSFRKTIWKNALKQSGVKYRPPYSMRHSHIAWALNIGADENRLVYLAGHSSKQMIYEVYGSYVPGIENDKHKILECFGEDFK
ncbi:MAG: tyrosine-type recombinase/integrase [Nitrospirae bacterium]|nr:tyrosine-type recombinase/integrase [Nitrospirota bacterium]MBI5696277.1 tyrosine-type recombinase/integrase [Nitrospirota bacterium]